MRLPASRWGLALGAIALGASLSVWAMHMPDEPVKVVPLSPPRLADRDPDRAQAEDAPEEEAPPEAVGTALVPEQLDRRQLEKGMNDVEPRVEKCRAIVPPFSGVLKVHLAIARSGGVQSVEVLGPEAATPVGACVAQAVKRASFPRYRGTRVQTTELTWPFLFPGSGPGSGASSFAPATTTGAATTTSAAPAR